MGKMKLPYIYNDLLKTGPLYDRFDSACILFSLKWTFVFHVSV